MTKILVVAFLLVGFCATVGVAYASPGPWKSGKAEVIPYSNGETLLKKPTGKSGFQLWITGNREMHCVYRLIGHNDGFGWASSSWSPGYMYKCSTIE